MSQPANTVTRTQLNQQTARVLARVQAGERLVVTDRGRPIAELVPHVDRSWEHLVAAGALAPAAAEGALTIDPAASDGSPVSAALRELRRDRS